MEHYDKSTVGLHLFNRVVIEWIHCIYSAMIVVIFILLIFKLIITCSLFFDHLLNLVLAILVHILVIYCRRVE